MITDITCLGCALPAFADGLAFWCPGCGKSVVIEVPRIL